MARRQDLPRRLAAISAEIAEERTQLGVLEEQVAFQREVAEEARLRALVAETPLADREATVAQDDLRRLVRSRDEARARLARLRAEQDALLERLAAGPDAEEPGSRR
jgi:predicted  nucleic acid-binding Zn-ribbon protein